VHVFTFIRGRYQALFHNRLDVLLYILSGANKTAEKLGYSGVNGELHPSVAQINFDSVGFMPGLKPRPLPL
jgi:hypothetical protein